LLPELYPILDVDALNARGLPPLDVLDVWLTAGVRLVQLRAKSLAGGAVLALADAVVARARPAGALVIVNDRADVARLAGADGVHLGQDDLPVRDARTVVGPEAIVGLSTHSIDQVREALAESATYVAFGPVFATASKGRAADPVVGLEGVAAAAALCRRAGRPLVAIGGITVATAPDVIAAGAQTVAVISDLLAPDLADRVLAFQRAVGAATA
jgi:thiamine-phosphate pyrophosphorylase